MKRYKTVQLGDEHQQRISVLTNQDGYWWRFVNGEGDLNGPFKDATEAMLDAQHFCDHSAGP